MPSNFSLTVPNGIIVGGLLLKKYYNNKIKTLKVPLGGFRGR
jgi:hypothetical protein